METKKDIETQKERMQKLIQAFDEKGVILKEEVHNTSLDNDEIIKASSRLREIARVDEWIETSQKNKYLPINGGVGTTVNTFIQTPDIQNQQTNAKTYNPNFTYLQASEALTLCIKRTLDSGAPVNNLGFYDEINWNLNNMGFNARMPIDIKNAIKKMISGE